MLNPVGERLPSYEHFMNGCGWSLVTTITGLGILAISMATLALTATLFVYDGFFIYHWTLVNPLHLMWALPITTAFISIDIAIAWCVGRCALRSIWNISKITEEAFFKAHYHFQAYCAELDR